MCDPISWLWSFADARGPVFDELSIRAILGDSFERLAAANYVVRTANAECVSCPACGAGHAEEVVPLPGANGQLRYYISCPTYFRVEIDPELLEQWTINWNALASGMAAALALAGQCTLLISDRLWRLGRLKWRGTYRDALLARGLSWHDGRDIARQIARNTRPAMGLPRTPARPWPPARAAVCLRGQAHGHDRPRGPARAPGVGANVIQRHRKIRLCCV